MACLKFAQDTSNFTIQSEVYSSKLEINYCGIVNIMNFFLAYISKELIRNHNILPSDSFIKFEFNLIYFVTRLHMNEEIGMIENSIDKKIRAIFNVIDFAC